VFEKFAQGAWLTVFVTGACILVCAAVRRHYQSISTKLARLDDILENIPTATRPPRSLDPTKPTAAILVGGYSGVGVHTMLSVIRSFPGHFSNFVFLSIGVVDSGVFKGADEIEALRAKTEGDVEKYVAYGQANGLPASARVGIGTEVAATAEELCRTIAEEFPRTVFFGAKVVFAREEWGHRVLHNETAMSIQRRLHARGQTMVVLPVMVK
jgi:hypothetical protein